MIRALILAAYPRMAQCEFTLHPIVFDRALSNSVQWKAGASAKNLPS